MNKVLQEKWRYFADNASMHGVRRVSSPGRHVLRRLVWAALLLAALLFVLYYTSEVVGYLIYPRLSTKSEVGSERPKAFPTITICNMNQIKRSYAENHLAARLFVEQFYPYAKHYIYNSTEQADEARSINLDNIIIKHLLNAAAHSLLDTVTWVWFYADDSFYTEQNMSEIFYPVLTMYGPCYSMNKSWEVDSPGLSTGVQFIINVLPEEYFASLADTMAEGAIITVHKDHLTPELLVSSLTVGPGKEARVGIMTTEFNHYEYGGCRRDVVPSGLVYTTTYSRSACMLECQQERIFKRCNCTSFYAPGNNYICRWEKEINCAKRLSTVVDCSTSCPDACLETEYDMRVSYSSFPSNSVLNGGWAKNRTRNETANMISVSIFFETLRTHTTTEFRTFTLGDFWSSLGGTLGLFLGSSVLTMAEVIELLSDMLITCFTYCSGKRKLQVNSSAVSVKVPENASDTA